MVVEMRNAILVGNHEGRRPLGKCRRGYKDNIKIDVKVVVDQRM
jgi:hypothetical protein